MITLKETKGEKCMIVDGKGRMFEDRRKKQDDRRKDETDTSGGRRKNERRKAPPQVTRTGTNKKAKK